MKEKDKRGLSQILAAHREISAAEGVTALANVVGCYYNLLIDAGVQVDWAGKLTMQFQSSILSASMLQQMTQKLASALEDEDE